MIKKSTIACLVCSALSAFVSAARAEALVVTPGGDNQITPPSSTVTYDSITFETQGQDFEKFLGKDKNIDVLNVTNGLLLNNASGGGKTIFNISAKEVSIGGVELGDIVQPYQTIGSILNIEANTFKAEVAQGMALKATTGTSINIGSSQNFVNQVVLGTTDDASAIYASSEGNVAIFGNAISIESGSKHESGTPIYVTGTAQVELNAKDRLDITSTNSCDMVRIYGDGVISLKSEGALNINGNEGKKAIWLDQTSGTHGAIEVKGKDVVLNGSVAVSTTNLSKDNNVTLEGTNSLILTAQDGTTGVNYGRGGAINIKTGYANLRAANFEITNTSVAGKSAGIFLGINGNGKTFFNGSFSGTGLITGESGIIVQSYGSNFQLYGNQSTDSQLYLNAKLAGLFALSNTIIKDTSVTVNVSRDTQITNSSDTQTRSDGLVGIYSGSGATVSLDNTSAVNKHLNVNVDVKADGSNARAMIALGNGSNINISNFDTVTLTVSNKDKSKENIGLLASSASIEMNQGIRDISITSNDGTALLATKFPKYTGLGKIDLAANTISLIGTGKSGQGLHAEKQSSINLSATDRLWIKGNKAINVETDGLVDIHGEATNQSLMKGDWSVNSGKATVALGTSAVVEGKLQADKLGTIDLSLGKLGTLQGSTATDFEGDGTGTVNLTMTNGSVWNVTEDSTASVLTLTDSTIDFSRWNTTTKAVDTQNYNSVKSKTFTGDNNTLRMQIDLANETKDKVLTDQLNITGQALGTYTADLKIDGKELVPNKFHSENWLISQGADSNMSILSKEGKNQYSGRGMVTTWGLAFVANGEEDKLNTAEGLAQLVGNTTGKGEGKWYLVRNDEEIVDPTPDPDPNPDPKPEQPGPNDPAEMQQITNLGISATQALSFASELEDLRGRLGEVRYGAQDGAWVRAGYTKETADGYNGRGFEQKTHDLHIGLDRIIAADEDSSWLVGGALRYAKSKQEGFTAARGGEGELEQYSAKLYATYMHAQGSYADFVVQAGRYSQDLTGLANDLSSAFNADYKTYGYGASIEVGHMFDFNNQVDDRQWFNHFFIEPQLQLSYFNAHGKDYKTSTGLAVSQSDADFLTGRAGVVLGKKFNYGTADDLDKRYFQVGLKGGVKYEFLGDQTIRFTGVERVTKERKADDVDGARYYYGVTADWQLSHNFRAYATVEREEGDHYTKDFDVSVGVKYQF